MNELTEQEKEYLLHLLNNMPLQGTPDDLRITLQVIDEIVRKLESGDVALCRFQTEDRKIVRGAVVWCLVVSDLR